MHQKTAALSIQPSVMEKSGSLIFISSYLFSLSDFLCERILGRITNSLRLIITDAVKLYTKELQYLEHCLSVMSKHNSSMVREILLNQYMTVKSSHFRNSEDTDTAEGSGRNGKDFTLCNVSAQLAVCSRL